MEKVSNQGPFSQQATETRKKTSAKKRKRINPIQCRKSDTRSGGIGQKRMKRPVTYR